MADRLTVKLTGIVLRQQGTHDSLCAYYSAAMLLCSLRPEFELQFDAPSVEQDPLYAHLPRRNGQTLERCVADWLTSGVRLQSLAQALNGAGGGGSRFRYRKGTVSFEWLKEQIDGGLPFLLGWESREMGNHTSLVIGYDHFSRSKSRWVRLLDPIRATDVIEWGQLMRLAQAPLEAIWCDQHDSTRPDKLTVARDKGAMSWTRLERWDPARSSWQLLR
jgi:hypothetical protein